MQVRHSHVCGGARRALALATLIAAAPLAADNHDAGQDPRNTAADGSYGIGYGMGSNLRQQGIQGLDVDALIRGLRDGAAGNPPGLTPEQLQAGIQQLQMATLAKQQEALSENSSAAAAFLAENAGKDGVVVLDSGLQYEVLETGDGAMPDANDRVTTHYHGTLIDGTVFDSSVERGEPATFPVNGVIAGWTEALQRMHVGDKWRLYVPPELAYGERGAGGRIPPNSALVFEVELLGVEPVANPEE